MLNYLNELRKVVHAPAAPTHASGDWHQTEVVLGTSLPSDYKALVTTYGAGVFAKALWLLNPFVPRTTLKGSALAVISQWQQVSDMCEVEYPFYPEKDGLLPCAVNRNADVISWRTSGDPEQWDLIVWDASVPQYLVADAKPLAAFLLRLCRRESPLTDLLLPDLSFDPDLAPTFEQQRLNPETREWEPLQ
jgi:hypothetical protein